MTLASGVPVVALAAGGPKDLVDHGRTDFLVPPCDRGALTEAVRGLVDSPETRRALAAQARAATASRTWSAVTDELIEHYRTVLAGGGPRCRESSPGGRAIWI